MAAPSPPVPRRGGSGASGNITKSRANWPAPSKIGTGKQAPRQRRRAFKLCLFFQTSALRARRYLIARRNHRWRHAYLKRQSRRRCIGSYPTEHRVSMPGMAQARSNTRLQGQILIIFLRAITLGRVLKRSFASQFWRNLSDDAGVERLEPTQKDAKPCRLMELITR